MVYILKNAPMTNLLLILLLLVGCSWERVSVTERYESGNPRTEITLKNREIQLVKRYFESGNIQAIQNYKDGMPHGESIVYDIDGNVIYKAIFENGIEGKEVKDDSTIS